MKIDAFPHHIFWNYKENAKLPENIVAKQVILYGDISDIQTLFKLISSEAIERIMADLENKYHERRLNFIRKIFLNV